MVVIITMAGKGERFRQAGYPIPKFRIEVKGKTLFEWSMNSLTDFYKEDRFVFISRKFDNAKDFIKEKCSLLGITDYVVKELMQDTDGQATTSMYGLEEISPDEAILIYNIDTYVEPGELKRVDMVGDGCIPCFEASGNHWSFVLADKDDKAIRVSEKERISDNCSIGAYYFRKAHIFNSIYKEYYMDSSHMKNNEKYIAPMYNLMINQGMLVRMTRLRNDRVHILGTPDELKFFADSIVQENRQ